ncbi:putative cytochrome P450 monooxygenase [Phlegmacium glaucopus]|nr:putative cytochrome P450 monooxygenase [Phlegmacium glaucopus]
MVSALQAAGPALLVIVLAWKLSQGKPRQRLPPGPPLSWSEAKNIWSLEYPYLQFTDWARKYGDIYIFKALGDTNIVLTSARAVKEVLDKHGALTGGRPQVILQNMVIRDVLIAHLDIETDHWKRGNKALHYFFTAEAVANHLPAQQAECTKFCYDLLDKPEDLVKHLTKAVASISLSLVYGKTIATYENSLAEEFHAFTSMQTNIMNIDSSWPDFILDNLPWAIAPWGSLCKRTRKAYDDFFDPLLEDCEQKQKAGMGNGCYMEYLLDNQVKFGLAREDLSGLALSLMEGYETSAMFLRSFIYTLITFQACQKRAQEEMDRVVGSNRLPVAEDFKDLPYLDALIKEHHRYRPLIPYGAVHKATGTVVYENYSVEPGDVILSNTWGINRDPELYDDAETFKPERYLASEFGTSPGADTSDFRGDWIFGSGRRKCPGYELGQRFVQISVMQLVWAFSFEKDSSVKYGNRLAEDINNYQSGPYMYPKDFTCKTIPRDKERAALLRSAVSS